MNASHPRLEETGSGSTIFYKGRYLYSSKEPRSGPGRIVASAPLLPGTLLFIPSFGLGYGLPELLERLPPRCHVLCVESDPALWRAADRARALTPPDERLTVMFADALPPVQRRLAELSPGAFRRVVTLPLCQAARLSPEFYRSVENYLTREIQTHWQNKMTLIHLGPLYIRNLFANLAFLPHAHDLDEIAVSRPIIVAGAGPSLPHALPLLRSLRDRAALLAVDTALPVLLAFGIFPDYVIALEPQFVNIQDFITAAGRPIPLLADLSSSPQVVRLCLEKRRCPVYFFSSEFHPLALWERLRTAGLLPRPIPPLGSVGVAAVHVALRLTRRPVLLCGLDFSYPFNRSHAPGVPSTLMDLASAGRLRPPGQREFISLCGRPRLMLAGKARGRVASNLVLSSYAQNLAALCGREQRVFDLNPYGLPLGAPVLNTEAEAFVALAGAEALDSAAAPEPSAPLPPVVWNAEKVRAFLSEEQTCLRETLAMLDEVIGKERPETGTLDADRRGLADRADYAHFHLAGKTAFPEYTQAFALQALLAGRYYLERLRRAEQAAV